MQSVYHSCTTVLSSCILSWPRSQAPSERAWERGYVLSEHNNEMMIEVVIGPAAGSGSMHKYILGPAECACVSGTYNVLPAGPISTVELGANSIITQGGCGFSSN